MQERVVRLFRGFLFLAFVTTCSGVATSCVRQTPDKVTLRVNLFPYLPDAAGDNLEGVSRRIKSEFEQENRSVNLEVTLNKDNDFYNVENYKDWLMRFDVVEPDTLFLSDLLSAGLIEDWGRADESDWQLPAREAATVNGKVYALPHWLCGYFLFSRDAHIAKAENIKDLVAALQAPHGDIPETVGNLNSSWETPTLYLESWEDNYAPKDPSEAISAVLDPETIRCLKEFCRQGEWKGKNPCLDKTFKDNNLAANMFAKSEAETTFGYSETLFDILKRAPGDSSIILSPLVLGNGDHPLLFMDGFVLRKGCNKEVREAARKFAEYMENARTYTWIVMSRDGGATETPRYLIPATASAFEADPIRSDGYYQAIRAAVKLGSSFPNSGLPLARHAMQTAILKELQPSP